MEVTDERLREIVKKLINENGESGANAYVASSDWDQSIKDRAIKIINGDPQEEVVMAEHGDISDSNGF